MLSFPSLLYLIIALLIGITVHEAAHAWMANRLGDPTSRYLGRITLNPLAHLDPLGTAMIFLTFLSGVGFGWGKPVPYNPHNLSHPKRDALLIALAGPISNFLCALILMIPYKLLVGSGMLQGTGFGMFFRDLLINTMYLNIALMAFNLLPIPPLDGSKIIAAFTPDKYQAELEAFFQYGPFILICLILFEDFFRIHLLGNLIKPLIEGTWVLINLIT